jgi:hypothetical protein
MNPVTSVEIMIFIQKIMTAFSDPLYLAFSLMLTFTIAYHIRHMFGVDRF